MIISNIITFIKKNKVDAIHIAEKLFSPSNSRANA